MNTGKKKIVKTQQKQPQKRKQQVKKTFKAKPKPFVMTTKSVIPRPIGLVDNIQISCSMAPKTLETIYAVLHGFLATKGLMTTTEINDPRQICAGLQYCVKALISASRASVQPVMRVPRIIADLMHAIQPKSLKYLGNAKITFGWNNDDLDILFPIICAGNKTWSPYFAKPSNDTGHYNSATIPYSATSETDFSKFLSVFGGLTDSDYFRLVDYDDYKSKLERDCSAFARNYVYNGQNPSGAAGGYYGDVESEVNITAPLLSTFVKYTEEDNRVARRLTPASGNVGVTVGLPLSASFGSYFNKTPPVFKIIDFDQIYTTMCHLMVTAIQKAQDVPGIKLGAVLTPSLPFTEQDFRIILRQALLAVFSDQFLVQFVTPLDFATDQNGFVPFHINGGTYSHDKYSTFLLPTLIKENLAALRTRVLSTSKSTINNTIVIPVLGRYVLDTFPQFSYTDKDGVLQPLFSTVAQTNIDLVTGMSASGTPVDLNGTYYLTHLQNFNYLMQAVACVVIDLAPIAMADAGPQGLGLLFSTSVLRSANIPIPTLEAPVGPTSIATSLYARNMTNFYPKTLERTTSKKAIHLEAIPAATITSLIATQTFIANPILTEMKACYDALVLPSIRLNVGVNEDNLTASMYQTEVREPHYIPVTSDTSALTSSSVAVKFMNLAQMCVPGIAREHSAEIERIMSMLTGSGHAGLLANLLGGLAKNILPPELHGVVDSVASVVPL